MKRHLAYFKYVLRHKRFVYQACKRCNVGLWQAIIHDWHKFLPNEWNPYAETFYKPDGSNQYVETDAFNRAWNLHQKRGKHHWQHWLLTFDRGETVPIEMEPKYVREMVADWWGAGKAITGKWEADVWYQSNKENISLHPKTRELVEKMLRFSAECFRTEEELVAKRIRILGY